MTTEPKNLADLLTPVTPDALKPATPAIATTEEIQQKYGTPEEVAKALAHAQAHIAVVESEKKAEALKLVAATAELQKRETLASLVEQVKSASSSNNGSGPADDNLSGGTLFTPPVNQTPTGEDNNMFSGNPNTQQTSLTPEQVQEMIASERTKTIEQENQQRTAQLLKESFGDTASRALQETLERSGIGAAQAEQLASTSPEALLSLVKGTVGEPNAYSPTPTPAPGFNSQAVSLHNPADTQTEAQKDNALRKSNYDLWSSAEESARRREKFDRLGPEAYYGSDKS